MTHRPRPSFYAGAIGHALQPEAALCLDLDRYALTVKHDGAYAEVQLGTRGEIAAVVSRTGQRLHGADELEGIIAGPPHSTLVGEFTGHTEAGIAEAAARGHPVIHLFDCIRLDGQPLARLPYAERHGALYRAQSWVESRHEQRDQSLRTDANGAAHGDRGRFARFAPRDLRRLPITPLHRGRAAASELLDRIDADGLEGAVACDLTAPAGRRGAKLKIKRIDTIDGTVLRSDQGASVVRARVLYPRPRDLEFTVPGFAEPGAVIEVRHLGWYTSGLPRHPSIVRERTDKRRIARHEHQRPHPRASPRGAAGAGSRGQDDHDR